jgi:ABC-2 type transport system permease protein
MKTLRDLGLLFLRPFLQNLRNPSFIVVNLSTPIMYLVLFMPLLKRLSGPGFDSGHVIQVFLPGIIALLFVAAGTGSVFPTIFELKKGLIERLRVTPSSRFALLMGPILSWVAWTLVSSAVIVALSVPFGFEVHAAGLVVFAVLLVLLLTVFAAWVTGMAVLMKGEITSISGIVVGLNLPIILLGGVMLPLALAPGWLRALAHLDPLYYAVEAGRDLCSGAITTSSVAVAFAVMVPLTVVVLGWATRVYRRAVA